MKSSSRRHIFRNLSVFTLLNASMASLAPFASAEVAEYELDPQYGTVLFSVLQEEYLYLVGRFDEFAGSLSLDPADLASARLDATVTMNSLDMADDSVVELLVSSSIWFNSNLYPEAAFSTESVTVTGENTAQLHGQLTFVGVTQPWTLNATFFGGSDGSLEGDVVGMQATGSFKRTDFGLDQYLNYAEDEVSIEVNVKFSQ